MTPIELIGDRLPAFAPLATISEVRNTGTPALKPIAIASGTTSATLEIAPGPTAEITQGIAKNISGIRRARPRVQRTAPCASRSSVPFTSAAAKSSVRPVSVRNSDDGKPRMTASAVSPAV